MDFFKNIQENSDFGASEDYSHFMSGSGEWWYRHYIMIGANMTAGHHDYYFDFDELFSSWYRANY